MTLNAILCEGNAEEEVMGLLLDHNCLVLCKDDLFYNELLRVRSAKKFCETYLRSELDEPITIYRILDSENEQFKMSKKLKKEFAGKIESIKRVITSEEMEILIIHAENRFDQYQRNRSRIKPSEYCKQVLGFENVKNEGFYRDYFQDINRLITAIHRYHQRHQRTSNDRDTITLFDLLKAEYQKWPVPVRD